MRVEKEKYQGFIQDYTIYVLIYTKTEFVNL